MMPGIPFPILDRILNREDEDEKSLTMKPETRESIKKKLQKINEMNPQDKEKVISQFRKAWHENKKSYDLNEQEKLRNEFNAACPNLKL